MRSGGRARVIFVSYAHEDAAFLDQLLVILKPLVRDGQVELWADRRIGVARRWSDEIESNLERAEIAVVLVSAELLASDYVMGVELPRLTERDVPLVCVPVGDCGWRSVDALASVQWPVPPERPLRAMRRSERDSAFVAIYEAVMQAATDGSGGDPPGPTVGSRPVWPLAAAGIGRLLGVPALPMNYQGRPAELEGLKEQLRASADVGLVGRPRASGLHGQGGVGKSVLAASACHDPEVRSWFPDGVIWVTLGEEADLFALQRKLALLLAVELESSTPLQCLQELRRLLSARRCLVVVDDVWSTSAAEAFGVTGQEGRILYTTRDPWVLTAIGASAVPVDVLSPAASRGFLERALGAIAGQDRVGVERLAAQTGGVLLALSLVVAMARAGRRWAELAAELEVLAPTFRDHPFADVFKAMRIAVDGLGPSDSERYRLLGVFPEDVAIPESTVARLWGDDDARPVLARQAARGLVEWNEGEVRLHDLQRAFAIFDMTGPWSLAHRQLLDAHRPAGGWAYLPDGEPYLWDHLFYHLHLSGEHAQMAAVATDGRWLARRLHRDGAHPAEIDAIVALAARPDDPAVLAVLAVLRRWAPLFGPSLSQADLAATLISRLQSAEADAEDLLGPVWRQPCSPLPEPPAALLRSVTGHTGRVNSVAFAPDGSSVASAGSDGTVRLWDSASGAQLRVLTGHRGGVRAVAFTRDGRGLASAGGDGTVRLWNPATGVQTRVLAGHTGGVNAVAFGPDGYVASAGVDATVRLWDAATGAQLRVLTGHTDDATDVVFAPDGSSVASASFDATVRLWDVASGAQLRVLTGHSGGVNGVAFAPDGSSLASAGGDATLRLWDPASGSQLRVFTGHSGGVNAVAFAPDGSSLASARGTVRLWDAASGAQLRVLTGHTKWVRAVAFAPDGSSVASAGGDGTVRLWATASGAKVGVLTGHTDWVRAVAFAPDESSLASAGGDATVRLWNPATGIELRVLTGHVGKVRAVAFAPDGCAMASAGDDATVRLWHTATGIQLRVLTGHNDWVNAVAFAPDGRALASASSDGTVQLWDGATGAQLHVLTGHNGGVNAVAFAPDGSSLADAGADGTVWLWDPSPAPICELLAATPDR